MIGKLSEIFEAPKSDLNLIYTERPFQMADGTDWGWFCREHALHTFVLARLLGEDSKIILGDVILRNRDRFYSTHKDDSDHAWCQIGNTVPVDLSIVVKHFENMPALKLVVGEHETVHEPYCLTYLKNSVDSVAEEAARVNELGIVYIEREVLELDPEQLLENPLSFLFPPPPGCRSFQDIHGQEIYDQITLHCFKLATGVCKPLSSYLNPKSAVQRIKRWNTDARNKILLLLQ